MLIYSGEIFFVNLVTHSLKWLINTLAIKLPVSHIASYWIKYCFERRLCCGETQHPGAVQLGACPTSCQHHLLVLWTNKRFIHSSIHSFSKMTIISYILFHRRLRRSRAQKVLFNLALALLAVYIIFLVGIEQTDNNVTCICVAALLQYFILVAFAWMLVEAVLQYLKFVKVFDTYVCNFMLKAAIPAWGKTEPFSIDGSFEDYTW